jgi:hypothetical protein
VLRAWYAHCGRPPAESLVVRDLWTGRQRMNHDEATVLQADLKASGMTREILTSKAHNVERIRFHDGHTRRRRRCWTATRAWP